MKNMVIVILACGGAAGGLVLALRSLPAHSQTAELRVSPTAEREAAVGTAYHSRLAENEAAAGQWKAAHPGGDAVDALSTDDQLIADNFGCQQGTQFWQRDRITAFCAPLCHSDVDCGPEDGRCRLLDVEDGSKEVPILLVDDLAAEEIDAVETDETRLSPTVRVCDPFWEFEGALDADLIESATTGDVP